MHLKPLKKLFTVAIAELNFGLITKCHLFGQGSWQSFVSLFSVPAIKANTMPITLKLGTTHTVGSSKLTGYIMLGSHDDQH